MKDCLSDLCLRAEKPIQVVQHQVKSTPAVTPGLDMSSLILHLKGNESAAGLPV